MKVTTQLFSSTDESLKDETRLLLFWVYIIVNTIEKGNEETHNLLREIIEEVTQQSKVNL